MSADPAEPGDPPDPAEHVECETSIVNEFGAARVRKVLTRNGERLEIATPHLGHAIRLDALALEALSWQQPELLSRLLENPLGPEEPEQ
jgi:hypothetical protein